MQLRIVTVLQVCADTIVGNQMIRGISGGQRKRVTTGEMIVGPMKTLFMVRIILFLSAGFALHPSFMQSCRNAVPGALK